MKKKLSLTCVALLFSAAASADDFAACVQQLRQKALDEGISPAVVHKALDSVHFSQRVVELDRRQPEFTETFGRYLRRRVTASRIQQGKDVLAANRTELNRIAGHYGVPAHYLVAFWGLETHFGAHVGNMPTLDSLATLACDQRRSGYFTDQLMAALNLVDRDGVTTDQLKGSWAGALGNFQFMPSVYLRYAVDRDGDGRPDLWNSLPDAAASAANYLQALGWHRDERWGREVRLPKGFPYHVAGLDHSRPLTEWRRLGVRRADGGPLPDADMRASLLVPSGHQGPAFLVYHNFRVIMGWNRSQFYALSVGLLADRLAGCGPLRQTPPEGRRLTRQQIEALQKRLNARGFDAGPPDGLLGPKTRGAIRAYQQANHRIADGHPDDALFRALGIGRGGV